MTKHKHKGRHRPDDNKPTLADIKTRLTNDAFKDDDTEQLSIWRDPNQENK